MTAIPLSCSICPQEPDFSDLSHLLTHVSSKGHLAHYLKAQLRGRDEADVRQKLDTYDQWYERHQIAQLLSQRLSTKASRHGVENERKPSTRPTKATRSLKRRSKKLKSTPQPSTPVKPQPAIDPQLSHSQAPLQQVSAFPLNQDGSNTGEIRLHVPHMSELQYWQTQTHRTSQGTSNSGSHVSHEQHQSGSDPANEVDSPVETDYFKAFVRSPTKPAYPESPDLKPSVPFGQQPILGESPNKTQIPNGNASSDDAEKGRSHGDLDTINSPILKGIKWPGMSLFDSACADAQRLRNQKKDRSILERMAQSSSTVEQTEHIYWPDGTLKKSRFISGNVESSPSAHSSPVLKPSRRTRTIRPRSILADLDTNRLTLPKRGSRKPKPGRMSLDSRGHESVSEPNQGGAIITSKVPKPSKRRFPAEGYLPGDGPSMRPRRDFDVFRDVKDPKTSISPNRLHQPHNPYESHNQPGFLGYHTNQPLVRGAAASVDWYGQPHSYPKTPDRSEFLQCPPRESKSETYGAPINEAVGRVTQRYFSASGNEEPQFFSTMPPQMEFGGMAGPKYRGATLNPLNLYLQQARIRPSNM